MPPVAHRMIVHSNALALERRKARPEGGRKQRHASQGADLQAEPMARASGVVTLLRQPTARACAQGSRCGHEGVWPANGAARNGVSYVLASNRREIMGLLDQVLGELMGGNSSPMQSVLMNMLGGGQAGGLGMPGQAMGGQAMGGGIGGLISAFEQAGLGHIAQSWVGNGPNQPVSPQQLQSVFGQQQVESMAGQAGMAPQDFLSQLSQHLPRAVDAMTPNGQVPNEGTMSV